MSDEQTTGTPDFESIRRTAGVHEYWSARDLMRLLGYKKWERFHDVIKRAIVTCETAGQRVEDHFQGTTKTVKVGSNATRAINNYFLSRFACYLIAQNGESSKPEIAAAQTYFAFSTRQNEITQLNKRLEIYNHLSASEMRLTQTAHEAGVLPENIEKFRDAGYAGLYGGLNQVQIKERKGIEPTEDLADRMGEEELASNFFRAAQSNKKLRRDDVSGEAAAIETHLEVGRAVRDAIAKVDGDMPENLSAEPSLKAHRAMLEQQRKTSLPADTNNPKDQNEK